jgi:hypothetical protein
MCTDFKDIEIQIIATCEMPSSNSQVFQYNVTKLESGGIAINYDERVGAANSIAKFSVSWGARRRLSAVDSHDSIVDLLKSQKDDINIRLNKVDDMQSIVFDLNNQLTIFKYLLYLVLLFVGCLSVMIVWEKKKNSFWNNYDLN